MNKSEIKKVIAVCSVGGRCGTSLTTALLGMSGFDVGEIGTVTDENNKKGYYEVRDIMLYMLEKCGLMGYKPLPESIKQDIKKHRKEFKEEIRKYFKGDQIALKTPYFVPVELFEDSTEIITISLKRETKSQALSISKLNNGDEDFTEWLVKWNDYVENNYKNDIEIYFDEWINEPYKTYLRLCEVVKPPKVLTEKEVCEFIDPSLKHY